MRSMAEPEGEGEEAPLPELERRLQAMEAARPADAKPLKELVTGCYDTGTLEAAQLEAFEGGVPDWWAMTLEELEGALLVPEAGSAVDQGELHPRVAPADQPNALGRRAAEVDDAPAGERPAVVDAHDDLLPGARVGDANLGAEGEGAMRGGERAHVEAFAIGGAAPVETAAVIGGDPAAEIAQDVRPLERGLERVEIDSGFGDVQVDGGEVRTERRDQGAEVRVEGQGGSGGLLGGIQLGGGPGEGGRRCGERSGNDEAEHAVDFRISAHRAMV